MGRGEADDKVSGRSRGRHRALPMTVSGQFRGRLRAVSRGRRHDADAALTVASCRPHPGGEKVARTGCPRSVRLGVSPLPRVHHCRYGLPSPGFGARSPADRSTISGRSAPALSRRVSFDSATAPAAPRSALSAARLRWPPVKSRRSKPAAPAVKMSRYRSAASFSCRPCHRGASPAGTSDAGVLTGIRLKCRTALSTAISGCASSHARLTASTQRDTWAALSSSIASAPCQIGSDRE